MISNICSMYLVHDAKRDAEVVGQAPLQLTPRRKPVAKSGAVLGFWVLNYRYHVSEIKKSRMLKGASGGWVRGDLLLGLRDRELQSRTEYKSPSTAS
jgi:hypothetical protein